MRSEYVFPTVLIVLDVLAALPYAWHCNWRMAIYWLAAATLTACVTHGEALPIPMLGRLSLFVGECQAVDKLLESHQKEIQE